MQLGLLNLFGLVVLGLVASVHSYSSHDANLDLQLRKWEQYDSAIRALESRADELREARALHAREVIEVVLSRTSPVIYDEPEGFTENFTPAKKGIREWRKERKEKEAKGGTLGNTLDDKVNAYGKAKSQSSTGSRPKPATPQRRRSQKSK